MWVVEREWHIPVEVLRDARHVARSSADDEQGDKGSMQGPTSHHLFAKVLLGHPVAQLQQPTEPQS
jgi:hypothetical protein